MEGMSFRDVWEGKSSVTIRGMLLLGNWGRSFSLDLPMPSLFTLGHHWNLDTRIIGYCNDVTEIVSFSQVHFILRNYTKFLN